MLLKPKSLIVLTLLILLSGYNPAFNFPPIKEVRAEGSFSQTQSIQVASFSQPIQLPHPGYISTHYSSWHPGIDIATGLGMPVRPILPGQIKEAVMGIFGLGHYVVVSHEQGIDTTYGHMGKIYVKAGDKVTQSSILGEVGLTGHTSGPHTHLEVTKEGNYINPETILPKIPEFVEYAEVSTPPVKAQGSR